jgi:hypothetical protein
MIMITVGVDYPPLGRSLLTLEKPLVPFWSVSLGLGEESPRGGAAAPSLATTGRRSAGGCSCRRRSADKNQLAGFNYADSFNLFRNWLVSGAEDLLNRDRQFVRVAQEKTNLPQLGV